MLSAARRGSFTMSLFLRSARACTACNFSVTPAAPELVSPAHSPPLARSLASYRALARDYVFKESLPSLRRSDGASFVPLSAGLSTSGSVEPPHPPPPVEFDEDDIVETFVRGSGPGGQKINKTASCVMLRHIPSGIVIRCQESRSQHRNRELARRILRERLDFAVRGEHSRLAMAANRERARKAVKRKKAVKKHFKSRRDRAMMAD
jgi:peptide chain release factor